MSPHQPEPPLDVVVVVPLVLMDPAAGLAAGVALVVVVVVVVDEPGLDVTAGLPAGLGAAVCAYDTAGTSVSAAARSAPAALFPMGCFIDAYPS